MYWYKVLNEILCLGGMDMNYSIREVVDGDRESVISIFNYFIENSMAAYSDKKVSDELFDYFKNNSVSNCFYVIEYKNEIVGFSSLRKHHRADTFNRTCELTYFILPDYTRLGVGSKLLEIMIKNARDNGIETLLASISSHNERSLRFHEKHGFKECGRFERVGNKFGKDFDIVWMQKFI